MDAAAAPIDPPAAWVQITSSPVGLTEDPQEAFERAALIRCGPGEAGLNGAAREALSRALRGLPALQPDAIAFAQRRGGEPHPWARAWVIRGKNLRLEATLLALDGWLTDDRRPALRRCAVASGESPDGTHALAVVAVDALADLAPLPIRGRTGQWLTVEAHLRVHAERGSVVILGPSGSPRRVPAWVDGTTLRARFALDRPGEFTVQVIATTAEGPRPVLEASVFADVEPPLQARTPQSPDSAPQESAPNDRAASDDALAQTLASALAASRNRAGESPLTRDPRLDAIARAHAARMVASRALAHDAGDGPPDDRLRSAGLTARATGENVAHAASVALAHASLDASPSHRANMLRRDFDRVGLAVSRDERGDLWVVETFASDLR